MSKPETPAQIVESLAEELIKFYELTRDPILKLGRNRVKQLAKQRIVGIAQVSDNRRAWLLKKGVIKPPPTKQPEKLPVESKLLVPPAAGKLLVKTKQGEVRKRGDKEVVVVEKEFQF